MLNKYIFRLATVIAVALTVSLTSCRKDRVFDSSDVLVPGPDVNFYALTADNQLLYLNAKAPNQTISQVTINGLQTGETLLSIDFRPATGELYAVGSTSRLYIVNPKTGATRVVGAGAFTPAINGTNVALDFNPTVDRIRLVTSAGQNLRLHPETGAVAATDGAINGVTGATVSSVAYTQNRAGVTSTVLFDIDAATDKLYRQDPPNDGKLVEVGALGFNVDETGGFDISPDGSAALAAVGINGRSTLVTIDVNTGKAGKIGDLPKQIIGLAIPTEAVSYAISANNELLIFNHLAANPTIITKTISGIAAGETILGIDFRPLNGQLYALGSTNRIYTVNTSSGALTAVGTAPITTLLAGTSFGFDFNPTVDRIRIVSNTGQNLRYNPNDNSVTVDGAIVSATAQINGAAYTNNFAGATTTVLFDIDSQGDRLYRQDPPNLGTLVDVGALGVNVEAANGFDIGSTSNIAYGLFTVGGTQRVYTVNLTTGAATAGPTIGTAARGFAVGLGF